MAGMWFLTGEGMLLLVLVAAAVNALGGRAADRPDRTGLVQFIGLVIALSALCCIPVTVPAE